MPDPDRTEGNNEPAGIYVHLPFCVVRCTYCDFYSLIGQDGAAGAYVKAIEREISGFLAATGYGPAIASVYIGGGTPSHLPAGSVARVLGAIAGSFALDEDVEITVEANPESATLEKLVEFRAAGANRISLGVQSFRPEFLSMMGRPHGPEAPERAIAWARSAGFENISLDLIYGLPGQSPSAWEADLDRGVSLAPEHLSAYLLETDKDTPLARLLASGALVEPDATTIAQLYAISDDRLGRAEYNRYEVSNWSRPGRASRHNLGYWLDRPYIGFGASAHSYYMGVRRACRLSAQAYTAAVASGEETRTVLDDGGTGVRLAEAIITALRLAEGADFDAIGRRYAADLWSRHGAALENLAARGWVIIEPPRVKLTREGILWSMDALAAFVDDPAASRSPGG